MSAPGKQNQRRKTISLIPTLSLPSFHTVRNAKPESGDALRGGSQRKGNVGTGKMKIKSGDKVIMLSGKDRGKTGKILAVRLTAAANGAPVGRVVVEGLNLIKRHQRARREGQKGQIVSKERAVAISSVQVVCPKCGKATRIGQRIAGNQKMRICKKCGGDL